MTENVSKMCLSLISKYLRDIYILYGHYWIPRTQKHGYRHQNRDSSYARAQVIAKHVISMVGHFECVIERG